MLYSIDLLAAGSLVVDHMFPAFMLFVALVLVVALID